MRRWAIVVFVVVIVIALILGGSLQVILSLLPPAQQQGLFPFIVAVGVTVIVANGIIAIMQWFGTSPLDFLPERTLKDRLRKQDPIRFKLAKNKDSGLLAEQAKAAKNLGQYDWMFLFAEAWIQQEPNEGRAYEMLGEALIELNRPQEAIVIGEKLTKLEPLNHEGFSILGEAYGKLGEREQSRIWHERALQVVTPDFREFVLMDLIKTYEAMGLVDKGIEAAEELLPLLEDSFQKQFYNDKLHHLRQIQSKTGEQPDFHEESAQP